MDEQTQTGTAAPRERAYDVSNKTVQEVEMMRFHAGIGRFKVEGQQCFYIVETGVAVASMKVRSKNGVTD